MDIVEFVEKYFEIKLFQYQKLYLKTINKRQTLSLQDVQNAIKILKDFKPTVVLEKGIWEQLSISDKEILKFYSYVIPCSTNLLPRKDTTTAYIIPYENMREEVKYNDLL